MTRDQIEQLIADALEYDPSYSVEDVLKEVEQHTAELVVGKESIVVWNLLERPNAVSFHIWIAAGDLKELMQDIYPVLEKRARYIGCDVMSISGRRGWIRTLKDKGFEEAATVAVKKL